MESSSVIWKKKYVTFSDLSGIVEGFECWNAAEDNPNFLKEDKLYREKFDRFKMLFRSGAPYYREVPSDALVSYKEFVAYHKWVYLRFVSGYGGGRVQ